MIRNINWTGSEDRTYVDGLIYHDPPIKCYEESLRTLTLKRGETWQRVSTKQDLPGAAPIFKELLSYIILRGYR